MVTQTRGLEAEQVETSLSPIGIDPTPASCMPSKYAGYLVYKMLVIIIHLARGGHWAPGWEPGSFQPIFSPHLSVAPRWSCRPTRKPCLCHTRLQTGTQRHPPTRRCDVRQAPALLMGRAELSRNPLLLRFGGPCGRGVNCPADFRTTGPCPPCPLACFSCGAREMDAHNGVAACGWQIP